jgi:hemerythrin
MSYIVWNDNLSVGVEVIDKQHMRIIDYINELHAVVHSVSPDRKERIAAIVNDTIDYTESHFGFEETLLEEVNYLYLKAHKRVHQLFVRRVLEYKARMEKGEDIAQELLDTLARWLLNHIRNEDKDYAKWLSESEDRNPHAAHNRGWLTKQLEHFFGSS